MYLYATMLFLLLVSGSSLFLCSKMAAVPLIEGVWARTPPCSCYSSGSMNPGALLGKLHTDGRTCTG